MLFRFTRAQGQTVKAHVALGLLALVWLNLAVQPCVMAASPPPDAVTQGAPTSAINSQTAVAEHDTHRHFETPVGGHRDCPHCALSGRQSCTDSVQCAALDAITAELTTQFKDVPGSLWMVATSVQTVDVLPSARVLAIDPPADPPTAGPPLIVRYCVYQI